MVENNAFGFDKSGTAPRQARRPDRGVIPQGATSWRTERSEVRNPLQTGSLELAHHEVIPLGKGSFGGTAADVARLGKSLYKPINSDASGCPWREYTINAYTILPFSHSTN